MEDANKKALSKESAFFVLGVTGFEPTTSATRTLRPTKLGHTPI